MAYYEYSVNEFETKLKEICDIHGYEVGYFTAKLPLREQKERIYEVTTNNKYVRMLIYSSLGVNGTTCADVGGDAVRVIWYIKFNEKLYYKKFKKHQRIETIFKNLEKTIIEASEHANSDEIAKWIYAVKKNN
jgi:hypothetical protein